MTTQSRAARAAAETLREMEEEAQHDYADKGWSHIRLRLGSYLIDYDDIRVIHEVEVYTLDDSSLRYYETDGWGNRQFSTRESVLRRIELAFEKGREISK